MCKQIPPPEATDEVSLDRIAALMRAAGIPAAVGHSGGNIATIFFGTDGRFAAGPGWFEDDGQTNGRASLQEFCYGPIDGDVGSGLDFHNSSGQISQGNEESIAEFLIAYTRRIEGLTPIGENQAVVDLDTPS